VEAILAEIDRRGFTQRQLMDLLDEYQPNVSNLRHGRISKVSIEKLLSYADRLKMRSSPDTGCFKGFGPLPPPSSKVPVESTTDSVRTQ
jgi:transcriptional regulator with XRE-family HTH domain